MPPDCSTHASPHLTWDEIACHDHDHTAYPGVWKLDRGRFLGLTFEILRDRIGRPLGVRSGYRTTLYNESLRSQGLQSATDSQHCYGRALDLSPLLQEGEPLGPLVDQLWALARTLALPGGLLYGMVGGLGRYSTFIHVDIRPGGFQHLAEWDDRGQETSRAR